ncbi:MAG: DarT ssDNA thymidine ADP-ribosyltransferase family protein [bacterium]
MLTNYNQGFNSPKLRGLYYITHMDNVESILKRGILSHERVVKEKIPHTPIYDERIVSKRKEKSVPEGKSLWNFANLFFQPRNAMLHRILNYSGFKPEEIVIIGLDSESILKQEGIYITDGNAVNRNTRIWRLDKDIERRKRQIEEIRRSTERGLWENEEEKRKMMAECLVPERVEAKYIREIYTCSFEVGEELQSRCPKMREKGIPFIVEPVLFFQPFRKKGKLGDNVLLVEGDIFFTHLQTLTITVNTKGVMGKGIAKTARELFKDCENKYKEICENGELKMGQPYLYKLDKSLGEKLAHLDEGESLGSFGPTQFLLFPTKNHWRSKADIKGIEEGLKWLVENYKKEGIESLAIPALGCGLGKLEWREVGPILYRYLKEMDIQIEIYLPVEKWQENKKGKKKENIWLLPD